MRHVRCAALMLGLTLLAHPSARAQTSYDIQPIIKLGDRAGNVLLQAQDGYFDLGTLNDNGQIIFTATDSSDSETLIQYSSGTFTPIVSRGTTYPGGNWPLNVRLMRTVRMNQTGNAVFAAGVLDASGPAFADFMWDGQAKLVSPITAQGKPVRYIRSVFLPQQARCLCLFEAPDAERVRNVNEAAQLPFTTVVEAVDLSPTLYQKDSPWPCASATLRLAPPHSSLR